MHIEGEAIYVDAKGSRHSIEGIGSLPDETNLQSLKVSGSISFGSISCEKITVEGECNGKSVTSKNISVSGSIEVNSINVGEKFKVSGSTDSEKLEANEIIMESRGGSINVVKCDRIKIFHSQESNSDNFFSKLFGNSESHVQSSARRVRIKKIDAIEVELQNCDVEEIVCKNAVIDSNCVIGTLIVEGEYRVSDDSKVGEVVTKNL